MPKATHASRKVLFRIIDALIKASPEDLSTNQIAALVGLHPGVVGAILSRASWAIRGRRVRINRHRRETRWTISEAALVDYARRNAASVVRKAAMMSARGIEVDTDKRGRVMVRCGAVTKNFHAD